MQVIGYVSPAHCGLNNGTIIVNVDGLPPFTYAWSNGATTANISALAPGDYTVSVTDGSGSTVDSTFTVDALFELRFVGAPEVFAIQNDCDNMCSGMVMLNTGMLMGSEPYTFEYTPISQGSGQATFGGLCVFNSYVMSVTDANGCPGTVDLSNAVMYVSPSVVTLNNVTPACEGEANGTMTVVLDGIAASLLNVQRIGGGYSQVHNPAWGVPYTITDLPAGDYDLISEIPGLCSHLYSGTVPQIPAPCGSLSGAVYNDADQDCVSDADEYGLPYRVLTIAPGPAYAITDQDGSYYSASGFGAFTLAQPLVEEAQLCPGTAPAPFNIDAGSPNVVLDLADSSFAPLDTRVSLWASAARPGFSASVCGTFWNASTYPSGEVTLVLHYDPMLDPVAVSPTPTNLTSGTAEWALSGLDAFEFMHFQLQGTVPADISLLGTVITFLATASDGVQELDMVNNAAAQNVTITGSVDPNDKIARTSAGHSSTQYFLDEDTYIDYTIRFQNTGTDTAFTVVVRDSLEVDLDPASLEILGASHAFVPSFENGRTLVFTFENINLPDSSADHIASNGSVHFRLKPRIDIAIGDVLSNSAGIYFDFNDPVITNTSELVVELSTQVHKPACAEASTGNQEQLRVFPNPAGDIVRITLAGAGAIHELRLYSADGREVSRFSGTNAASGIDLSSLSAGAYVLRAFTTTGIYHATLIKR